MTDLFANLFVITAVLLFVVDLVCLFYITPWDVSHD